MRGGQPAAVNTTKLEHESHDATYLRPGAARGGDQGKYFYTQRLAN